MTYRKLVDSCELDPAAPIACYNEIIDILYRI